jgi:hypothetical protein
MGKVAKYFTADAILDKRKRSGAGICSQTFARLPDDGFSDDL